MQLLMLYNMHTLSLTADAKARPPQDWEVLLGFLQESISLLITPSRENPREEECKRPVPLVSVLDKLNEYWNRHGADPFTSSLWNYLKAWGKKATQKIHEQLRLPCSEILQILHDGVMHDRFVVFP